MPRSTGPLPPRRRPAPPRRGAPCRRALAAFIALWSCALLPRHAPAAADGWPALALRWEVTGITASADGEEAASHARFTLRNDGAAPLAPGWTLWFTAVGNSTTADAAFPVRNEGGTLFSQGSPATLPALAPGESVSFPIEHPDEVMVAEKGPTGPYLTTADDPGHGIAIRTFTRIGPRRTTPGVPAGLFAGTEDVFRANLEAWSAPGSAASGDAPPVLPAPKQWRVSPGAPLPALLAAPRLEPAAAAATLASEVKLARGLAGATRGPGADARGPALPFTIRLGSVRGETSTEAYRLVISRRGGARVTGPSATGVYYGLRTLEQLLAAARREGGALHELDITDAPRYAHRGLMIDIARNFRRPAEIERIIDVMAAFKLNRLHLHLSDDEGWRLEIPALPELTTVGARRGHCAGCGDRLPPAVGSGPDVDDVHGSGFLTGAQYIGLLRHAAARHVEVIPEIDLPGHSRAAIRAMEARNAARPEEHGRYRLVDPGDTSRYESAQLYRDNVIDPGLPSSIRFVGVVVDELARLHRAAGMPLRRFHLGGDEVPRGAWSRSPSAAQLRAMLGAPADDADAGKAGLWDDFFDHVLATLDRHGIAASGWEEMGMVAGNPRLAVNARFARRGVTLQVWDHFGGSEGLQHRFANAGYRVLLSPGEYLYFGTREPPDPADASYGWARDRSLARTFGFDPESPQPGEPALEPGAAARIEGIEAAVWTEWVRGPDRLDEVIMPRLLAVAERAWAPRPAWVDAQAGERRDALLHADWLRFDRQLGTQVLPYIDQRFGELRYRLPAPGALAHDGVVEANYAWPGVTLRYTRDGSRPDATSPVLESQVPAGGVLRIIAVTSNGRASPEARLDTGSPTGTGSR